MVFDVLSEWVADNGDKVYHLHVPPSEMIYIGYIIEGLEGYAHHTLVDRANSILCVEVVKDYVGEFEGVLGVLGVRSEE